MSIYGEGIRRCREVVGLSQKKLADKVGVSQQAVFFYEQGINVPDGRRLALIADALGVALDDLRTERFNT